MNRYNLRTKERTATYNMSFRTIFFKGFYLFTDILTMVKLSTGVYRGTIKLFAHLYAVLCPNLRVG